MRQFKKILVGVDLSQGDKLVGEDLAPPTSAAIEQALWLAKLNSAHLQFFYTLDIGYPAQLLIQEEHNKNSTVFNKAKRALERLVQRATDMGLSAEQVVTFGKSWLGIIRQVIRDRCDLVIVGAKDRGPLERLFIGSTGMKLLRKCPCPVWVTHAEESAAHDAILVGHDLTEVGDLALDLAASMAELHGATLHVVHAMEPVFLDAVESIAGLDVVDENKRREAYHRIREQLERFNLPSEPQVHVVSGPAAAVLLQRIEQYKIDLLVMGTIARTGVNGLIFGNTAERLLPQVNCSVIAVKPADFRSPVTVE